MILIVLLQCGTRLSILVYYQLNKKFIASTLCVNKAKPSIHCNGKCYLAKKLKAQEKKESELPKFLKELPELTWFVNNFNFSIPKKTLLSNQSDIFSWYSFGYFSSFSPSIFQPPRAGSFVG